MSSIQKAGGTLGMVQTGMSHDAVGRLMGKPKGVISSVVSNISGNKSVQKRWRWKTMLYDNLRGSLLILQAKQN